jgi:hypothetical protein
VAIYIAWKAFNIFIAFGVIASAYGPVAFFKKSEYHYSVGCATDFTTIPTVAYDQYKK